MTAEEAFELIEQAIRKSEADKDDGPWLAAVGKAELVSQGQTKSTTFEEVYIKSFGDLEVRFEHKWHDTSRPFELRPDVTQMRVDLLRDGRAIRTASGAFFDQ